MHSCPLARGVPVSTSPYHFNTMHAAQLPFPFIEPPLPPRAPRSRLAVPPAPPDPAPWLSANEAAGYLRLSPKALYQRVARAQVKACRMGRALRFRKADLDKLMLPLAG